MAVGIIKAGHHRLALAVDYSGLCPPHRLQLLITGNQQNPITLDGHQFGGGAYGSMVITLAFLRIRSADI